MGRIEIPRGTSPISAKIEGVGGGWAVCVRVGFFVGVMLDALKRGASFLAAMSIGSVWLPSSGSNNTVKSNVFIPIESWLAGIFNDGQSAPSDEDFLFTSADEATCLFAGWANGTMTPDDLSCRDLSVLRMSRPVLENMAERARSCAAAYHWASDCVLFVEVGLLLPGFYLRNRSTGGLTSVFLPELVRYGGERRRVSIKHPQDALRTIREEDFFEEAVVRSIRHADTATSSFDSTEQHLVGMDAFCFQEMLVALGDTNCVGS